MPSSIKSSPPPLILISCGGTGGHLIPGLALGEQIAKRANVSVLFLVNDKKVSSFVTPQMKSECRVLPEVKYAELGTLHFWRPLWRLFQSLSFLLRLFLTRRVAGTVSAGGGAGTLPIGISRLFGVPAALLEQNVIMGRANRLLLRFVQTAYLSLPCSNLSSNLGSNWGGNRTGGEKLKCLGNPLRESLLASPVNRSEAARKLGLEPDGFTLLILGGSQGAKALNEWAMQVAGDLKSRKKNLQLIHLTGNTLLSECRVRYQQLGVKAYCEAFCEDMAAVYALSDFCVSRAGGGALAELGLFRIPTVYVPFPFAAEDHQQANALLADTRGAGWKMEEKELLSQSGKEKIAKLLEDGGAQERCRENQKKHAAPNAAADIADDFLKSLPGGDF